MFSGLFQEVEGVLWQRHVGPFQNHFKLFQPALPENVPGLVLVFKYSLKLTILPPRMFDKKFFQFLSYDLWQIRITFFPKLNHISSEKILLIQPHDISQILEYFQLFFSIIVQNLVNNNNDYKLCRSSDVPCDYSLQQKYQKIFWGRVGRLWPCPRFGSFSIHYF